MARFAHLTQGKAGSQWVTDVLSDPRILAYTTGIRFERTNGIEYRLSTWDRAGQGIFAGPIFSVPLEEWLYYRHPGDRGVFVHRDPRDGAVSWMFSLAYSHVTEPHVELMRPALLALDRTHRLMVSLYTSWESAWVVRSWAGFRRTQSEYVTSYERIVADQFAEFRAMLDFFEWPVPDDVLREVIDDLSFSKRSGGRPRGETNPYSHYRRGLPGDWRNHFTRPVGKLFENANPGLLVELGYEASNDWYQSLPDVLAEETSAERSPIDAESALASGELLDPLEILERLDVLAKQLQATAAKRRS